MNVDLKRAYLCALLCSAVYNVDAGPHPQLVTVLADCSMGTARMVVYEDAANKTLFCVSRGTEANVADWLHDFDVNMVPWSPTECEKCSVHDGFLNDMMLVKQLADAAIVQRINDGWKVVLAGHSKGGAACVMYGMTLLPSCIDGCYTFGQPKIGGDLFVNIAQAHYADRYFRFVNDDDMVPHTPPASNFKHFGDHFILLNDGTGKYTIKDTMPPLSFNIVDDLEDHRVANYVNRLEAAWTA